MYTVAERIKDLDEAIAYCLKRAAYLTKIRNRMKKLIDKGIAKPTTYIKDLDVEMW
jgi:hypothetical protein